MRGGPLPWLRVAFAPVLEVYSTAIKLVEFWLSIELWTVYKDSEVKVYQKWQNVVFCRNCHWGWRNPVSWNTSFLCPYEAINMWIAICKTPQRRMAHRSPELEDRTIEWSPILHIKPNHSRIGIESQTAQYPGNINAKWGMPPTAMVWLIEPNRQRNKFFWMLSTCPPLGIYPQASGRYVESSQEILSDVLNILTES